MSSSAPQASVQALYDSHPGLRLFRLAFAAAQRVWPRLAVRAASRVFGTPLPPRWLQRQPAWEADWRLQRWPFEDAALTVYSRPQVQQVPQAPVVLLVHGWGGHARQMLPLADAVAKAGLHPVIVEMPAHGRSDGRVSNLPQFARAIDYVAARLQQDGHQLRAVAAHSLGGNAAAYAASRGLPAERLVLLAPPASARDYTRLFAQVFGLSEKTRAAMQALIEAREGILMAQFEPPAVGPRVAVPTLVVHDRQDRVNPHAHGEAFAQSVAGARLLSTEGLGHRKLLKDPDVLEQVAAFVR